MVLLQRRYIILGSTQIRDLQMFNQELESEKVRCNAFGVKYSSKDLTRGVRSLMLVTLGFDMQRRWRNCQGVRNRSYESFGRRRGIVLFIAMIPSSK